VSDPYITTMSVKRRYLPLGGVGGYSLVAALDTCQLAEGDSSLEEMNWLAININKETCRGAHDGRLHWEFGVIREVLRGAPDVIGKS
jgi:hypothetical protein